MWHEYLYVSRYPQVISLLVTHLLLLKWSQIYFDFASSRAGRHFLNSWFVLISILSLQYSTFFIPCCRIWQLFWYLQLFCWLIYWLIDNLLFWLEGLSTGWYNIIEYGLVYWSIFKDVVLTRFLQLRIVTFSGEKQRLFILHLLKWFWAGLIHFLELLLFKCFKVTKVNTFTYLFLMNKPTIRMGMLASIWQKNIKLEGILIFILRIIMLFLCSSF